MAGQAFWKSFYQKAVFIKWPLSQQVLQYSEHRIPYGAEYHQRRGVTEHHICNYFGGFKTACGSQMLYGMI